MLVASLMLALLADPYPVAVAEEAYKKQDYEGASKIVGAWVKINPDSKDGLSLLGAAEFMRGDMKAALEAWDRQVKVHKASFAPHWQRGIALYYAGRYREGREQFEAYQAVESPRGEMGYYVVSDGTAHPYRVKVRSPSFSNLHALPRIAEGRLESGMGITTSIFRSWCSRRIFSASFSPMRRRVS